MEHRSRKSSAEASEAPSRPKKLRGQPTNDDGRCPFRKIAHSTEVRERRRREVEAPLSPLFESPRTREGLEQPISDVPFEVSSGEDEPICFLKRQDYKVSASVGCDPSVRIAMVSVVDSGVGPILIQLRCLAENWRLTIRLINSPPLKDALKRPMRPLRSLVIFVRTGQFRAPSSF